MTDCIFCKIARNEIPAKKIYEDEDIIAFADINPKAPVHILVVPVRHLVTLNDAKPADKSLLAAILLAIPAVARKAGIADSGYKVISNNGFGAGQLVGHLHFHVLGGWKSPAHWEV